MFYEQFLQAESGTGNPTAQNQGAEITIYTNTVCHLRYSSISTSDNYGVHNLIQWFNQTSCLTFRFSLYNIHTDAGQMEQRSTIFVKILSWFSEWREKKMNVDYAKALYQLYLLQF
jgi:hypothetical protein